MKAMQGNRQRELLAQILAQQTMPQLVAINGLAMPLAHHWK